MLVSKKTYRYTAADNHDPEEMERQRTQLVPGIQCASEHGVERRLGALEEAEHVFLQQADHVVDAVPFSACRNRRDAVAPFPDQQENEEDSHHDAHRDAHDDRVIEPVAVGCRVVDRAEQPELVRHALEEAFRYLLAEYQPLDRLDQDRRVVVHAVHLAAHDAFGVENRGLQQVIEAASRGAELESQVARETLDRLGVGGEEVPVHCRHLLVPGEILHRLRRIARGVETDADDGEAVLAEHRLRTLDDLRKMPRGGGADVEAAGIDQADHQRLAAIFREPMPLALDIVERVIAHLAADGGLADRQCGVAVGRRRTAVAARHRRDRRRSPAPTMRRAAGKSTVQSLLSRGSHILATTSAIGREQHQRELHQGRDEALQRGLARWGIARVAPPGTRNSPPPVSAPAR